MAAAAAAEPALEGHGDGHDDDEGCFTTEEDFLAGLEELLRAYGAYTAVTGPAASRPRLQACVAIMDKLALSLEAAEAEYSAAPGRLPYVNLRGDYLIGGLLAALSEGGDEPLEEVLAGMLLNAEPEASAAAARLLLASAPFYSDKAPPAPFHILREESAFERLIGWVGAEAAPGTTAEGALRVFATGLMAVLLLERDVADYMVRTPIPFVLLKRLHAAPLAFDDASAPAASVPASVRGVTGPELARRGAQYGLACLTAMGEYQEMLTPFFQEETLGLDVVTRGLERPDLWCRLAAVELVSRLLAHKKFAMAFVQQARGVETIVALSESPQAYQLHAALAMCLFGLASLANVMEEVCRLPPHTFHRLMAYAIALLRCPQEAAQKSVVLFFSMALAFRPVLQAFDAAYPMGGGGGGGNGDGGSQSQGGWSQSQELLDGSGGSGSNNHNNDGGGGGLYCLLNLLRSGGVLSGAQGQHGGPAGGLSQRRGQLAHYTTLCLRHHLRVHLALLAAASSSSAEADAPPPPGTKRPRLNSQDLTAASTVPSSYFRPVEVDDAAADALLARVRSGALKLPPDWAPIRNLLHHRGLLVLLGVVAASNAAGAGSGARAGASETARFALDCLEMATLLPAALEDSCLVPVVDGRTGMQILLEAASGLAQRDADVMRGALRVLCNCVCPPGGAAALQQQQQQQQDPASRGPSPVPPAQQLQQQQPPADAAEDEKVRRAVRRDLRAKDGIKVLVALLRYRRCIHAADEVRALAARALLGLAQEAAIAQILEKMRLSLLLSEVVRAGPVLDQRGATAAAPGGGGAAGGVGPGDHYATLRAAAMQLIARITGRPASAVSHSDAMDPASWKLEKAAIVARTPVTYDPQDLLLLIHHHLQAQGLHRAARVLEAEAGLPVEGSGTEAEEGEGAGHGGHHHGPGVGGVDDAAAQVAASGVLSSASACAARIAAAGAEEEGTGMDVVVGAAGDGQLLARTTSLMQSPEPVAGAPKAGAGNGRRSGAGGGKAAVVAAAAAKPHTPLAVATALTSPAGHGSKGITPGRGALKRSFADVVTSPTSATSVGAKQLSQQQQQQQQQPPQPAAGGALPAPAVVRCSSLDHLPRTGSSGGAASQGARTPASTATTSATATTAGGGGGGAGGAGGAGLRRLSSASSASAPSSSALPHRTSRLFPAGLSLRRSGSSGFGLNLRAAASPAAAGGGAWPTPTPSLLDLPSPFTTHKLVPPPSTVAVGGGGNGLGRRGGMAPAPATTLDKIVVQYLRRQHEQCPNPICALPPFSLTLPHRCPEPPPTGAAANVSRRLLQRQTLPPYGGYQGRKLTRSLVFSRFRPWRSYRDEAGRALTCTAFPRGAPGRLWAGNEDGTIHLFNVWTSEVERSWECHPFRVSSLCPGPDAHRPLLLSCASEWDLDELHSETCLWGGRDLHAPLLRLPGIRAAVFDAAGTRLAGLLSDNAAQVYDAEVGTALRTLRLADALGEGGSGVPLPRGAPSPVSPATGAGAGGARTPNVCFSPADGHLVLSDGVLWDVRTPASTVVHRFDRLSSGGGNFGAFHPNGHDALIDGTVWDLRTHGLRTMVPGVERCAFKFSACGEVIYAYRPGGPEAQAEEEAFGGRANKRGSGREATTCVQVLDAQDYHTIHVHETERRVLDVAVDDVDMYLSIVEGSATPVGPFLADDALCRLYEVGRRRPDEADSDLDDAHSSEDEDDDDWRDEEEEASDSELDFDILNAQESAGEETDATGESGGGGGGGGGDDGSGVDDDDDNDDDDDGESTGGEGSELEESSADSASSGSSGSEEDSEEEDSGDDEAMALQWLLNQQGSDDDSEGGDESYHGEDSDLDEQF